MAPPGNLGIRELLPPPQPTHSALKSLPYYERMKDEKNRV